MDDDHPGDEPCIGDRDLIISDPVAVAQGPVPGLLCATRGGQVVADASGAEWCVGGQFDGQPVGGGED